MSDSLVQIGSGKARLSEETLFPWSASRLKTLLQCPRQFRFAYLDRLPTTITAPLAFGRALHEAIQWAHEEQMVKAQLPPVREIIECFDGLWTEAIQGEVLFRPSHPAPARYVTRGHEMLRIFHAQNRDAKPPLMVELPFEVQIEAAGECFRLRGIIDRVDEMILPSGQAALVVVDYKSGVRKMKSEEAQGDVQLTLYALVLRQTLGMPVQRVELHHLRGGQVLICGRGERDFTYLTGEVLPCASQTLAQAEFAPHPGFWCRWCDFQEPCQREGGATYGLCR